MMKTINTIVPAILMSLSTAATSAAQVVFYDFEDGVNFSNAVELKAAEVFAASAWSVGSNSVFNDGGDLAGNSKSIKALWDSSEQYFEFSFEIAPGFRLNLDGVSFAERFGGGNVAGGGGGGGAGPKKAFSNGWNLLVNGIEKTSGAVSLDTEDGVNGADANRDTFHTISLDRPLAVTGLAGNVTIRLTGDAPVPALKFDGTPFGTGDWRVDSFSLSGTFSPIPIPGAVWLFGSALTGMWLRRRRAS